MQYKELEPTVYTLLRSGRLAQALILISEHRASFAGADRYDYLHLKANVQLLTSPLNAAMCAGLVEEVMAASEARPLTKLKTSFLGAHIADEMKDADAWQRSVAQMFEYLPADERFRGRALRGVGDYKAKHGTAAEAIAAYEAARVWHLCNIGPHDERDRLCFLGLVCADLVRLLASEGRVADAQAAADTARASIPEDAFQRVYVPISDAHIGLAAGDLAKVATAVAGAEVILAQYPSEYAARQLNHLRISLLSKQGRIDQARDAALGMASGIGRLRDLSSLRASQTLVAQLR
ncbi:MAG: hypothetical protein JWN15_666 [Firmicutes bacterium]|nr:hypothetical protein [Bacillota bacterium]